MNYQLLAMDTCYAFLQPVLRTGEAISIIRHLVAMLLIVVFLVALVFLNNAVPIWVTRALTQEQAAALSAVIAQSLAYSIVAFVIVGMFLAAYSIYKQFGPGRIVRVVLWLLFFGWLISSLDDRRHYD